MVDRSTLGMRLVVPLNGRLSHRFRELCSSLIGSGARVSFGRVGFGFERSSALISTTCCSSVLIALLPAKPVPIGLDATRPQHVVYFLPDVTS